MKNYKLLAVCLTVLSYISINAMNPQQGRADLLRLLPKSLGGGAGLATLGTGEFEKFVLPSFVKSNITGVRPRIRNMKIYLNYISLMLDTVPNTSVSDLPKITTKEGQVDLAQQTREIMNHWKVTLNYDPENKMWFIQKAGSTAQPLGPVPATVDEAIQQAEDAAKAVVQAAAGKATQTQVDKIKAIGTELQKATV